jgi:hypothetical protein
MYEGVQRYDCPRLSFECVERWNCVKTESHANFLPPFEGARK